MANLKNTTISDTGFLQLPTGTTAQRPGTAAAGQMRYNTTTNLVEWYDDEYGSWFPAGVISPVATGGTVTDISQGGVDYRVHSFTSVGTSTFTVTRGGPVEFLIVAGGGSGGCSEAEHRAGGGGAGGLLLGVTTVTPQGYTISVGSGGASRTGTTRIPGNNGTNSSALGFTANGGGGGAGGSGGPARVGGSGGGGHYSSSPTTGANGTSGQGHKGGDSVQSVGGGGGGGAAEPGFDNGEGPKKQFGGNGLFVDWADAINLGDNGFFGGGGGSGQNPSYSGSGGLGGGGAGATTDTNNASPGQANTGGGGGGTRNGDSGAGGSGIVIVRYRIS